MSASRGCPLVKRPVQWMAVGGGGLEVVAACLDNAAGVPVAVKARLVRVEHVWDYRREVPVLAETELLVPPGADRWLEWPVALGGGGADIPVCSAESQTEMSVPPCSPGGGNGHLADPARRGQVRHQDAGGLRVEQGGLSDGYVRLELAADSSDVFWRFSSAILPGQVAGVAMSATKLRRLESGVTLAFRVSPGQAVYAPAQALTGVTRAHRSTNLWRSDPGEPMPQWFQLAWDEPVAVTIVELTFPGHLLRELHAYPPFYRDPQIPRDYVIEALVDGGWQALHFERGNYQRHRRHSLPTSVMTKILRIVVLATNGDPSAALHEVRVYG